MAGRTGIDIAGPPRTATRPACAPECGPGWRPIIDRCCFRISAALQYGEAYRFEGIRGHTAHRIGRPALGRERSQCVCELCGAPGRLYHCESTASTRCAEQGQGVLVRAARVRDEKRHLAQQAVIGRVRLVVCHRYDPECDCFIDVRSGRTRRERDAHSLN